MNSADIQIPAPARVATVAWDRTVGSWTVRCRPAGPAGAHQLRLPFGVLARTDRATPRVVLDASVLLDAHGDVADDACGLLELLVGSGPLGMIKAATEGRATLDTPSSPARDALLALIALDLDEATSGPSFRAAEAALLAAQAHPKLAEWAQPLLRHGAEAVHLLQGAGAGAGDRDGAARAALRQLAGAVGLGGTFLDPPGPLADLDRETFEAMWSGAATLLAATAPTGRERTRGQGGPRHVEMVDLTGMPLNPTVLKRPVTVEYDQHRGEVTVAATSAVPVAALWLRVIDPDGYRSCQVPFVETGDRRYKATAVAQGRLGLDFYVEIADSRTARSVPPGQRAARAAQNAGAAARNLVDALLSAPPTATPGQWEMAALAWTQCAEAWTDAFDEPRNCLARALAAACSSRAKQAGGAASQRRTTSRSPEGGPRAGWATPYLDDPRILDQPRPKLAALLAPLAARWAHDVLDQLELPDPDLGTVPEVALDDAVATLTRTARMTGDDPAIRRCRAIATIAIANIAVALGRTTTATNLLHQALTDLTADDTPPDDPVWREARDLLIQIAHHNDQHHDDQHHDDQSGYLSD